MPLCIEKFSGLSQSPDSYNPSYAQVAQNVDLSNGRLDPWRTPTLIESIPSEAESIFIKDGKLRYSNGKGVRVVTGYNGLHFISDPCDCLYFRKDWCDSDKRVLGLPRPPTPEVQGLSPPPTDEDCWTPELVTVQVTYESQCGHFKCESQPSHVSNSVKCKLEDELRVVIPSQDNSKFIIDKICVYLTYTTWDVSQGLHGYPALGRNLQGRAPEVVDTNFETSADIDCFKVAELVYTGSTQSIIIEKDKCFGKRLATTGWRAPDQGMCLAGQSDTGSLVAFTEECLSYSVRNHPQAWRLADIMNFGDDISFACHHGLQTYVITVTGNLFIVLDDNDCTDKGSHRTVRHIGQVPKPCVDKFNCSKATLCDRYGVIYPSDEGLMHVLPDGSLNKLIATDKDGFAWARPISLALYKDYLFISGFSETYVMTLPLISNRTGQLPQTLSTIKYCPKCFYEDCGILYLLDYDGKVYTWDTGDQCLPIKYRSSIYRTFGLNITHASIEYTNFTPCEVLACPGVMTVYKNGKHWETRTVNTCNPKRIKRVANSKSFEIEYYGEESVRRICVGSSQTDLGQIAE